ncbi:MAG: BtrH N-terminal domain-containing protein [Frankiaceae bacterium]
MRVQLDGIEHWRHDLGGCLHASMAVLLRFSGLDPLEVLGAAWGFYYDPGDLRREEYYFPSPHESLLAGLAPYHPVRSRWHVPADAAAGWREVRSEVAGGRPVVVAVDNYQLPFRPAYRDVHTNHLVTVHGFDDERGEVLVTDPVPPRFSGAIPIDVLTAARDSGNPIVGERDLFFTGNPIGNRWLEIDIGPDLPAFDLDFVREVIARNQEGFRAAGDGGSPVCAGLHGERRFLDSIADKLAAGGDGRNGGVAAAADEGFVVAAPVLAVTGLHADWLARAGRRFGRPRLVEAARAVERVAHHWTAFRIAVATARADPAAAEPVRARGRSLVADHERALDLLEEASAAA